MLQSSLEEAAMKTRHVLFAALAISILFYAFTADATAIKGTVARYDPGHSITVLGPDNRSLVFTLAPGAEVSGDIQEGRVVYLIPESDSPSAQIVKISLNDETPPGINNAYVGGMVGSGAGTVVAGGAGAPAANASVNAAGVNQAPASMNPVPAAAAGSTAALAPSGAGSAASGSVDANGTATGIAVTLPSSSPASATSATTTTSTTSTKRVRALRSVNGVVQAFSPGESLTIRRRGGTVTTYSLNASSRLPDGLAVGQRVAVLAGTSPASLAQQVTLTRSSHPRVVISNQ
jgi:hypothetical protein